MVAENFCDALRAFQNRKPFKPYVVQLVSGERIVVEHPEALVFRNGVGVFISPRREITILDHEGVISVMDPPTATTTN
jgi:hypothetical protein